MGSASSNNASKVSVNKADHDKVSFIFSDFEDCILKYAVLNGALIKSQMYHI